MSAYFFFQLYWADNFYKEWGPCMTKEELREDIKEWRELSRLIK